LTRLEGMEEDRSSASRRLRGRDEERGREESQPHLDNGRGLYGLALLDAHEQALHKRGIRQMSDGRRRFEVGWDEMLTVNSVVFCTHNPSAGRVHAGHPCAPATHGMHASASSCPGGNALEAKESISSFRGERCGTKTTFALHSAVQDSSPRGGGGGIHHLDIVLRFREREPLHCGAQSQRRRKPSGQVEKLRRL
jgi:hypothetical protein